MDEYGTLADLRMFLERNGLHGFLPALDRVEAVVKAARPFAHRDSAAGRRLAAALAVLDPTERLDVRAALRPERDAEIERRAWEAERAWERSRRQGGRGDPTEAPR